MPTFRARIARLLIKHLLGRKFEKAGHSIAEWRKLDGFLKRNQKPLRGTRISAVKFDGLQAEWVHGPEAGSDGAILYFHGGAFFMGSPASSRELVSRIYLAAVMKVLSGDYRLAPENPFPAAVDDAVMAYEWLLDEGYAPSQIVIGGESSGGGLALQAHAEGADYYLECRCHSGCNIPAAGGIDTN